MEILLGRKGEKSMLRSLPFFAFGIMLIVMCIALFKKFFYVLLNCGKTKATVVGIQRYIGDRNNNNYILKYVAEGSEYTIVHDIGSVRIYEKHIGKQLTILYRRDNPKQIILLENFMLYIMGLFFGCVGVWLMIMGIGFLVSW